ncbi:hypothetical protein OR1_01676 [Geobacter sp. OR-1]|uniref:hypothetical protein n=1 Tax=Geobacter sp. OR-1 TaxID=1266765 RepID=UPI00054351C4|nr:hypothetical protein [Geobacter sp. OR-1]GAM09398.1 hypothetical protein OR1_01676 [Geobacter sp. OR-1]
MPIIPLISALFLFIFLVFLTLSLRDFLAQGATMTIRRRIWLRMAMIFAAVAAGLYFLHRYIT